MLSLALLPVVTYPLTNIPTESSITAFVTAEWKKLGVPGMSVAIVEKGKITYARGFGFADVQHRIASEPTTTYRIGSLTKQFTATMIMQMIQEGKLMLSTKLGFLLSDCPVPWREVTVQQLLNHTAGIPSYTGVPGFLDMEKRAVTPEHINDVVSSKPLDFVPGTQWKYSNSGYILLGLMIEKIDHRPFSESLKFRILEPLGMQETYFGTDEVLSKHLAQGYTVDKGKLAKAEFINMTWPFAAGGITSTVLDLAKWDAGLYGEKILPRSKFQAMWKASVLSSGRVQDYGYGWAVGKSNGISIINHSGGINGFTSFIQRAPSIGTTIIILTNWDHSGPEGAAIRIAKFVDPRLAEANPPMIDTAPETTKKLTTVLRGVLSGHLDPSSFSLEMQKVLSPEALASFKAQASSWGKLSNIRLIKTSNSSSQEIRTYLVSFENADLKAIFVLNSSGVIEGFILQP